MVPVTQQAQSEWSLLELLGTDSRSFWKPERKPDISAADNLEWLFNPPSSHVTVLTKQ